MVNLRLLTAPQNWPLRITTPMLSITPVKHLSRQLSQRSVASPFREHRKCLCHNRLALRISLSAFVWQRTRPTQNCKLSRRSIGQRADLHAQVAHCQPLTRSDLGRKILRQSRAGLQFQHALGQWHSSLALIEPAKQRHEAPRPSQFKTARPFHFHDQLQNHRKQTS